MKFIVLFLALLIAVPACGEVEINLDKLGRSLGGWKARKGKAAEYDISESLYRTYQPET